MLAEIEQRGSFERRDEMLGKYPPTALELLKIQGLGPKSIRAPVRSLSLSTVDDLERLCREQKLRELPRMGAKLEEKVLRSIAAYRQRAGRFLLNFAQRRRGRIDRLSCASRGRRKITPPAACAADAKPSAIWIFSSPARARPTALGKFVDASARRRKCWAKARTKPASNTATKACRWTCARCRRKATARRCNISPAARITTSRCANVR